MPHAVQMSISVIRLTPAHHSGTYQSTCSIVRDHCGEPTPLHARMRGAASRDVHPLSCGRLGGGVATPNVAWHDCALQSPNLNTSMFCVFSIQVTIETIYAASHDVTCHHAHASDTLSCPRTPGSPTSRRRFVDARCSVRPAGHAVGRAGSCGVH